MIHAWQQIVNASVNKEGLLSRTVRRMVNCTLYLVGVYDSAIASYHVIIGWRLLAYDPENAIADDATILDVTARRAGRWQTAQEPISNAVLAAASSAASCYLRPRIS